MAKSNAAGRTSKTKTVGHEGAALRTTRAVKTTRAAKAPKFPKAVSGAVDAARDKKAVDIVVLDLRKAGGFTDYFVICTGNNPRQITAISDAVVETLKKEYEERPALAEGVDQSEWVLLDYFNFVVHVFSRECRAFYDLERLWGNADRYEFDDVEAAPERH